MKMNNEKEDKTHYLPIFMSIGLSVGVAIGAATNKRRDADRFLCYGAYSALTC